MEPANKGKRYAADPLTREEAMALLDACGSHWTGFRNRAHIALLWRTGMRCGESCSLQLSDVRFAPNGEAHCSVRIMAPKGVGRGKKPRELGLDATLCSTLHSWIRQRGNAPGPLFTTRKGGPLSTSFVRQMVRRVAKRAGITRRVHPHVFRHTFARNLYEEKVGMVHIQHALGHSNLETTAGYLQSIGATEVIEATAGRQW